mmetsp:Transcript_13554/g.50456  ORF Transcript_13554/g.50456 Transcript_13554/m.50456 type:complete len:290 (+) Transcript_13554:2739-3608(+)
MEFALARLRLWRQAITSSLVCTCLELIMIRWKGSKNSFWKLKCDSSSLLKNLMLSCRRESTVNMDSWLLSCVPACSKWLVSVRQIALHTIRGRASMLASATSTSFCRLKTRGWLRSLRASNWRMFDFPELSISSREIWQRASTNSWMATALSFTLCAKTRSSRKSSSMWDRDSALVSSTALTAAARDGPANRLARPLAEPCVCPRLARSTLPDFFFRALAPRSFCDTPFRPAEKNRSILRSAFSSCTWSAWISADASAEKKASSVCAPDAKSCSRATWERQRSTSSQLA